MGPRVVIFGVSGICIENLASGLWKSNFYPSNGV